MNKELNTERVIYEVKRLDKLIELKRLADDPRYDMYGRFTPNVPFAGAGEPEIQIGRRIRNVIVQELEKQIREEGEKLQQMFNNDIPA
jgi:hypothetical protein